MDVFKELTFKETSTTTTNFRRKDFNYIQGILEFLMMYIYSLVRVFNNQLLDSPILFYVIMYIFHSQVQFYMDDPISCITFNIIVLKQSLSVCLSTYAHIRFMQVALSIGLLPFEHSLYGRTCINFIVFEFITKQTHLTKTNSNFKCTH